MDELPTFLRSVFEFLFSDSDAVLAGAAFPTLIFAVAAALLGVLVVLVDYLMSLIPYPSFLKLVHSLARPANLGRRCGCSRFSWRHDGYSGSNATVRGRGRSWLASPNAPYCRGVSW